MATIIIRRDGKRNEEVVLEKGFTLVGKSPSADIRIEDLDDSEEHASIAQVGESYVLNDLTASAAIQVNGQTVKKRILKDRDLITIGEYGMTFQDKRESDQPGGIEMEVAQSLQQSELAKRPIKFNDSFRAGPGGKSNIAIFVVLGVVLGGVFYASYQSYAERKETDARAAQAKAAAAAAAAAAPSEAAKKRDAERIQESARVLESSIKR